MNESVNYYLTIVYYFELSTKAVTVNFMYFLFLFFHIKLKVSKCMDREKIEKYITMDSRAREDKESNSNFREIIFLKTYKVTIKYLMSNIYGIS